MKTEIGKEEVAVFCANGWDSGRMPPFRDGLSLIGAREEEVTLGSPWGDAITVWLTTTHPLSWSGDVPMMGREALRPPLNQLTGWREEESKSQDQV